MARVEKLTINHILGLIDKVEYVQEGCSITCFLHVGDSIVNGTAYAYDMKTFDEVIGKKAAYDKAVDQLFAFEAYHQKRLG